MPIFIPYLAVITTVFLFQDDGFATTAAEPWVKQKVGVVHQYLTLFVSHVAAQADEIVLVDLFAGNGLFSLGARKQFFFSNTLLAMAEKLPIQRYVLCNRHVEDARLLKIRINRFFRGRNVIQLEGRPEELLDRLKLYIPPSQPSHRVAVFCLADPFSFELPFAAIDKMADMGFSFVIPFAFPINSRLNFGHYLTEGREKLQRFMGGFHDVERLGKASDSNFGFYKKLVQMYSNNMLALGFNVSTSVHKVESGLMELPMYYIGFYAKTIPVKTIQHQVAASGQVQFQLFN